MNDQTIKISKAVLEALGIRKEQETEGKKPIRLGTNHEDLMDASKMASVIQRSFCGHDGYPGTFRRLLSLIMQHLKTKHRHKLSNSVAGCMATCLKDFEFSDTNTLRDLFKTNIDVVTDLERNQMTVYIPALCPIVDITRKKESREANLCFKLLGLEGGILRRQLSLKHFGPIDLGASRHQAIQVSFELQQMHHPVYFLAVEVEYLNSDGKDPGYDNLRERGMRIVEVVGSVGRAVGHWPLVVGW